MIHNIELVCEHHQLEEREGKGVRNSNRRTGGKKEKRLTHCHGLWQTRCWQHTGEWSRLRWGTGVHTETREERNQGFWITLSFFFTILFCKESWGCSTKAHWLHIIPAWNDSLLECKQRCAALAVSHRPCWLTLSRKCSRVLHRAHWSKMEVKVKVQTNRKSRNFIWYTTDPCTGATLNKHNWILNRERKCTLRAT